MFAFLLNFLRSEADTFDVMQDVFIKLTRRPELLRGMRDERSFLLRTAHNLAIDLMRRQSTRGKNYEQLALDSAVTFAGADPDEQVFRKELAAALGKLPAEQRSVVHLKLWEGLTFEAIAETLEIPMNTAASRYRYGIDKLRERLRPIYDEIKE